MTAPVLPPLPEAVGAALPASTPPAPWVCRVEAVVWWHRARPAAQQALPAWARAGLPVTVGALITYLDSPVGTYRELLASPVLLRGGGLVRVTVPFIAVDSVPSIAGGRTHWSLPKEPARFAVQGGGADVAGEGWSATVRSRALGPALPLAARFATTQDGARTARSLVRGRGALARVDVDGAGLPDWLAPGRHPGLVLRGARLVVGAPR